MALRPTSYGYARVEGKVVVIEEEAAVLRDAFDRYTGGAAYRSIANNFNSRGVTTISGGR